MKHPDAQKVYNAGMSLIENPTALGNDPEVGTALGALLMKFSSLVDSGNSIPARRGLGYEELMHLAERIQS